MTTLHMASARAPSVPGFTGIHSSAFWAVSVKFGSTTTSLAPRFFASKIPRLSNSPWFAPSMFMPQRITYFELAKSCIGKTWPKIVRQAERRSCSHPDVWAYMLGEP